MQRIIQKNIGFHFPEGFFFADMSFSPHTEKTTRLAKRAVIITAFQGHAGVEWVCQRKYTRKIMAIANIHAYFAVAEKRY